MKLAVAVLVLFFAGQQVAAYYCPYTDYFACEDGLGCVPEDDRCDGEDNCLDGSDEDNCFNVNIGLAVGLAIGGFVLFIILPIVICVVICCCLGVCAGAAASGGRRRTQVVTHTMPSAGPQTTVVSSNTSNAMQSPVGGVGGYAPPPYGVDPNQYQPAPYKM